MSLSPPATIARAIAGRARGGENCAEVHDDIVGRRGQPAPGPKVIGISAGGPPATVLCVGAPADPAAAPRRIVSDRGGLAVRERPALPPATPTRSASCDPALGQEASTGRPAQSRGGRLAQPASTGRMSRTSGPSALPDRRLEPQAPSMSAPSAELLVLVAVFVLLAVAAGTICARLFMAASRDSPGSGAPDIRDT